MKTYSAKALIAWAALALLCAVPAAGRQGDPPRLKPAGEERYLLTPGDVLEIHFRYTPEFNQTVTVQPDGYVSLEAGGEVKVGGLTLGEARAAVYKGAVVRLKDPDVAVVLKEFQKPYFVVAGEVAQPGRFEMRERVTAIQAIMLAGGFRDSARSSQVLVFRKINSDTAEVLTLDLKKVKKTRDLENDLRLEAGDMVMVPRNTLSRVERYIKLASVAALFNPFLR